MSENVIVSTIAGDGGMVHRDGEGSQAQFKYPHGVAIDKHGNYIITQGWYGVGDCIRMITHDR